jgi:hypothetical protein
MALATRGDDDDGAGAVDARAVRAVRAREGDDDDDDDAAARKRVRADVATARAIVARAVVQLWLTTSMTSMTASSSRAALRGRRVGAASSATTTTSRSRCAPVLRADGGWLDKLNPFKKSAPASTSIEQRAPTQRGKSGELLSKEMSEELFGKGLMGKLASKAVNAAAGALKEQFESAREVTDACYDDAVRAVKLDSAVLNAFGGSVECGPVISQSSSSVNVNGTKQTRVGIAFQCRGANGVAGMIQAQSDGTTTTCVANLQDGRQFQVGSASSVYGDVIDVDASDVIDV